MNRLINYANPFHIFSGTATEPEIFHSAATTTEAAHQNKSLMRLSYEQKVSQGLMQKVENCDNCICFGDEWPL